MEGTTKVGGGRRVRGKGQVYSYSVNTNEIQIRLAMLREIVGKVSFVEFGTVGALEVQQFSRPNT